MGKAWLAVAMAAGAAATAMTSAWAATPLSVRDSWRIGSSGTSFCSVQSVSSDKALGGMFDAGYSITCRDAALPVGKLFKLHDDRSTDARLASARSDKALCKPASRGTIAGLGAVDVIECRLKDANVTYRAYQVR